jgi:diguanylate cyclase (GGDEF)-like protein
MSGPERPARRGRILLVGAAPAGEIGRPLTRMRDLFAAIGEIASAKASDPVDAVLVDRAHAGSDPHRAVEAIRRIDPAVRVILIGEGERVDGLEGVSDSQMNGSEAASAGAAHEQVEAHSNVQAARAGRQGSEGDSDGYEDREASSPLGTGLGDTDLVDAVLAGEDVAAIGLRIISEQTGWRDVRLVDGGVGEILECGGLSHGRLVSEAAERDELKLWAEWLAHWLTLARRHEQHRCDALQDDLTGAWNRRFFTTFLDEAINRAGPRRRPVTVMVFDLDDFKRYNDAYGHAAGDEILIETVRLLSSVIRKGDRVCRIGGDEFAVVFADPEGPRTPGSAHPETLERIAQRFQNEICQLRFPKLGPEAPGSLTISAGLATYPWDGRDARALLEHADLLALQSKRKGKNVITLGPGAMHICREGGS